MHVRHGHAVAHVHARRRRAQKVGKAPIRRIRRQPRRAARGERDDAQQQSARSASCVEVLSHARVGQGQQQIAEQRAQREKAGACSRARRYEVDIARALRTSAGRRRPRGDELDDEGPGKQRSDDQPVRRRSDEWRRARHDATRDRAWTLPGDRGNQERLLHGFDIDCDCSRSKAAAIGSASASAGSTRCHATSAIHDDQDGSTIPADSMPPVGSHRVRAAMNMRMSDISSGGIEMSITDAPAHQR